MKGKENRIAIWMDHAFAKIVYPNGTHETVKSTHVTNLRVPGEEADGVRMGNYRSSNNEYGKHQSEQNELHDYFNRLFDIMKKYRLVMIMGPTTAGIELRNFCIEKDRTHTPDIILKKSDYLSDEEFMEQVVGFFELEHYV